MKMMENISMAFGSLKSHTLRSILTMLGIIIGVGAVIIVVAIGQGGEAMLKSQIIGSGNTIELFYRQAKKKSGPIRIFSMKLPSLKRIYGHLSKSQKLNKWLLQVQHFPQLAFRKNQLTAHNRYQCSISTFK